MSKIILLVICSLMAVGLAIPLIGTIDDLNCDFSDGTLCKWSNPPSELSDWTFEPPSKSFGQWSINLAVNDSILKSSPFKVTTPSCLFFLAYETKTTSPNRTWSLQNFDLEVSPKLDITLVSKLNVENITRLGLANFHAVPEPCSLLIA